MRFRALLVLLLVATTALLAACGDDDDDAGATPAATSTPAASEPTATVGEEPSPTEEDSVTPTEAEASPTVEESPTADEGTATADDGTPTNDDGTAVPGPGAEIPDSPVGDRLAWVIEMINSGAADLSPEVIEETFAPAFLAQVPADQLAMVIQDLSATYSPVSFAGFLEPPTSTEAAAIIETASGEQLVATIVVEPDEPYLISGLVFQPVPAAAQLESWEDFEAQFSALAPNVNFLVAEVTGEGFEPIHEVSPDSRLAVGSTFKLYVLGELARQVEAGEVSWDEELAIRDEWKSLPSGVMQDAPAGTVFPLRQYAELMISISDNTATDHLLYTLGRENVEAMMAEMGHGEPELNIPLLSTQEMFALKLAVPEEQVNAYIEASAEERRAMLDSEIANVDVSLDDAQLWASPRYISEIEWFASPEDIAQALTWLDDAGARPGLEPIREIMSMNPGVPYDEASWARVSFKGGSEPGVFNLSWLLEDQDGRRFVMTGTLNDESQLIDETAAIGLFMGAFDLLAANQAQ